LNQNPEAAEALSTEEFVRISNRAGLKIDPEYVARISGVVRAAEAAYRAIRSMPVSGHEPALVFQPVKRTGTAG
jgi:hypothetical protein